MKQILFEGIRKDNGEKVVGCLINNMFFCQNHNSMAVPQRNPVAYILPNMIDYDSWHDIAEQVDAFEVVPESVKQLTFLD